MKTGLIKVRCGNCGGDGQIGTWGDIPKGEKVMPWIVEDCGVCDAKGSLFVPFKDKRQKPSFKTMARPNEY